VRLGIKAKQVAGVTILVGLSVILLSAWYLSEVARVHLQESSDRAELAAKTIFIRAFDAIAAGAEPQVALQSDPGLQSILRASLTTRNIEYASIVDTNNVILADGNPDRVADTVQPAVQLQTLLESGRLTQLRVIADRDGRTYEYTDRLALQRPDGGGAQEFATIRVGVSTLLIRSQLEESLRTPLLTVLVALIAATLVSMLLAQVVLRPIHVIRTGLARLGRGELDVKVDLSQEGELADLGDSFKAVSERLAADQSELAGQKATLESVVEHLEEAVALFAPDGALLFANPAMRATLHAGDSGSLAELFPESHPYRHVVEETLKTRKPQGPRHVSVPGAGDRLILTHIVGGPGLSAVEGPGLSEVEGWVGVMLVARNLAYLSEVESTLSYSRKLAALGRLSAGIAHEVKNPLNATMIHLELLKMQVQDTPAVEHVRVIAAQVRRLDEVVQGFLKFTRPADPDLRPTALDSLVRELLPIIHAEASKSGVEIRVEVPASLPDVSADAGMLQQAFLNLALNACQAMPHGGRLRIAAAPRANRRVEVVFEDTGQGIAPDHLERIFDLYFTTKDQGTGIGLSMVYRTVQLHDGDIEVQSVVGKGTTFRVTLRQA
jgi:C4-dicarboxylate-specific signal transduction histidine kinase